MSLLDVHFAVNVTSISKFPFEDQMVSGLRREGISLEARPPPRPLYPFPYQRLIERTIDMSTLPATLTTFPITSSAQARDSLAPRIAPRPTTTHRTAP